MTGTITPLPSASLPIRAGLLTLVTILISASLLVAPSPARAAEVCDGEVCITGASWDDGVQLDDKARAKQRKRHRKGNDATLTVELASGRGSVFLDGVWVAVAPINYVPLGPGQHDLEIRDGERVLARGVLEIAKQGGEVHIRVGH